MTPAAPLAILVGANLSGAIPANEQPPLQMRVVRPRPVPRENQITHPPNLFWKFI
jgi:hypothetical protein